MADPAIPAGPRSAALSAWQCAVYARGHNLCVRAESEWKPLALRGVKTERPTRMNEPR